MQWRNFENLELGIRNYIINGKEIYGTYGNFVQKGEEGNMIRLLSCMVAFLLIATPAFAARPLATDNAGTVDPIHFKIEEGLELSKTEGATETLKRLVTAVKFGILPNWDIGVEVPYNLGDPGGFGMATLKNKIRFVNETGPVPGIAIRLDVTTARSSGGRNIGALGILSKNMGPVIGHLNIGYTIIGNPDSIEDWKVLSYGGALEFPINDSISIVGELVGDTNTTTDTSGSDIQAGVDWTLNDTVMLDVGVSFGRAAGANRSQVTAGITLNL